MRVSYGLALLVLALSAAACFASGDADQDVCGDMVPTDKMFDDPNEVLNWIRQRANYQRDVHSLYSHPVVIAAEQGKLTADDLRSWVVNEAYALECGIRSMGEALNKFGFAFPEKDGRELFYRFIDNRRAALDALKNIAQKVGINDMEDLLKHDPNPTSMLGPSNLAQAVMHAQHVAEVAVPFQMVSREKDQMQQRIKIALKTNPAYKNLNLNDDDLLAFDIDREDDDKDVQVRLIRLIRDGLDRKLTLCQVRRRVDQANRGHLAFWDGIRQGELPREDESF